MTALGRTQREVVHLGRGSRNLESKHPLCLVSLFLSVCMPCLTVSPAASLPPPLHLSVCPSCPSMNRVLCCEAIKRMGTMTQPPQGTLFHVPLTLRLSG